MKPFNSNVKTFDDVRDALNKMDWKPTRVYTPVWTTAGTAPALGNGTLQGFYSTFLGLVFATIQFTAGSSTTFGTGAWSFSLPAPNGLILHAVGGVHLVDSGTTDQPAVVDVASNALTFNVVSGSGIVTASVPWTWATGDSIRASILYALA